MSNNNGTRTEVLRTPVAFDSMYKGDNQKAGTLTVQLRQKVQTNSFYPSKKVGSDMNDSLFSAADFGFAEQKFESIENRVAWIMVPTSKTEEQVKAMLATAVEKGACIYRVLDSKPILDDNQKYAVASGLRTMDEYAATQAIRYPKGSEDSIGTDISGQLVTDKAGNVQYRRTFFSATPKEDVEDRAADRVYQSAAIKAELQGAGALLGQTV